MTQIRIALVGLGLVGARHADALKAVSGGGLVAVVDQSDAAKEAADQAGVPLFAELSDMIREVAPDGVILATPTILHLEHARICVKAGLPVLIEKPISDDLEGAARLVEAASKAGVPTLVGHHRRYNPLIRNAKEIIETGQLGDIRAVQATCWFYKPDHYFEAAPWRKLKGAGPISVNLVHDVDLLRHLCGEVAEVRAQAAPSKRGFENEDVAAAVLTFDNGAIGTISVSDSIVSPWSWELTSKEYPVYPATNQSAYLIGGSKGALSIPDQNVWRHAAEPDWWSPISATAQPVAQADPLIAQMEHFIDVIEGRAEPLVSGLEGLRSLRVVDAIQKSAETGDEVILSASDA